jgi:ubiquinone biosynthesis protein COQ9
MIRPGSLQVPIRAVKNARVIRSSQIPASHGVDQAILAAAYTQVPRLGFTPSALVAGARDCGYLDAAPSILADGSFLLIRYHMVTKREEIAKRYKDEWQSHEHPDIKTVLGRVERLFWSRLTSNSHVIHHWPNVRAQRAGAP